MTVTPLPAGWTEDDSRLYRLLAPVAVPARAEQLATLLTLLPFKQAEPFRVVELGCGEGLLSFALLNSFPKAELIAFDGSPEMRVRATRRLESFGSRVSVRPFDLAAREWLADVHDADCALSSLCVHHLTGPEKRALFAALHGRLSPNGVLLIADLIEPQRPESRRLFAATWDRLARTQSTAETGSTDLFDLFVETEWNYYSFDDPTDTPSPLFEQLLWLKEAGFAVVDCFWLQAGHAIYGGYKTDSGRGELSFAPALRSATHALRTVINEKHN